MKIVETRNSKGEVTRWSVPELSVAMKNSIETHGIQYDPVERRKESGCIPMVWEKISD